MIVVGCGALALSAACGLLGETVIALCCIAPAVMAFAIGFGMLDGTSHT